MKVKRGLYFLLVPLLIVGALMLYSHRYDVNDWWALRNYDPPQKISDLAVKSSMSDYGRRLFYVHYPEVQEKGEFSLYCDQPETGLILGCYDGIGIYILDVTEEQLEKVELVTAAHEMLHVGYERLSSSDREYVNGLLANEYSQITNERIEDIIDQYRQHDPSTLNNELHSIIGTEISDISPELENYYSRYFVDRQVVVSAAHEYEQVFVDLQDRLNDIESQLNSLRSSIDSLESSLAAQQQHLQTKRSELDDLFEQGDIEAYNSLVEPYNSLVAAYNSAVDELQTKIQIHNQLVSEYDSIALQKNDLVNSLDSSYQPIN